MIVFVTSVKRLPARICYLLQQVSFHGAVYLNPFFSPAFLSNHKPPLHWKISCLGTTNKHKTFNLWRQQKCFELAALNDNTFPMGWRSQQEKKCCVICNYVLAQQSKAFLYAVLNTSIHYFVLSLFLLCIWYKSTIFMQGKCILKSSPHFNMSYTQYYESHTHSTADCSYL